MVKVGIVGRLFCRHKNSYPAHSHYQRVAGTFGRVKVITWKCPDCGKEWKTCVNGDQSMKIIFDSKEQKQEFIDNICPNAIGFQNNCRGNSCEECYKEAGIEVEVKNED